MSTNNSKKSQKDNRVKFLLAPRPQRDPLAADFEAPQNVLIPQDGQDISKIKEKLKDLDPQVFVSETETKKGMLERAYKPDGSLFDKDILKALSNEFDFGDPNNLLDDDFVDQAGGLIEDDEDEFEDLDLAQLDNIDEDDTEVFDFNEYRSKGKPKEILDAKDEDDDDDKMDDCFEEEEDDDDFEETKSVFTNYSLTSSVLPRNDGLKQIDEHFERLYEREYADDTEIGGLDLNEVKGTELLTNVDQIKQFKKEVKIARMRDHDNEYTPEIVSDHYKNAIIGDQDDEKDLVEVEVTRRENRVDCESILSYTSTLFNHPKLIVEPRKRNFSRSRDVRMDVDEDCDTRSRSGRGSIASTRASIISKLSIRPDNESREDKRIRKHALKQYRRERRQERKQNEKIFKLEKANLAKQERNNKPVLRLV